jgi:hypothetical protein
MWRAPTESDLLGSISSDELEGLRGASLAQGQSDPVAPALQKTVDLVRGYIAGNAENVLGPEGTLPERLIGPAMDVALVSIGSRVVGIIFDPDNIRRDNSRAAIRLFERVSEGKYQVEKPDTAAAANQQATASSPSFSDTSSTFDRTSQDGI